MCQITGKSIEFFSKEKGMEYYLLLDGIDISYSKFIELVNVYIKFIDSVLDGKSLDSNNIPFVVAKIMVELENIKSLKGVEKKRLLGVLLKIYTDKQENNGSMEYEQQEKLNMFLSNTLSTMIDTMISIDKGQINISKLATNCCMILLQQFLLRK